MTNTTVEVNNASPAKQARILDAAQKRFAHYGLCKTTMDEIAGDLGISKAALYYYFKTKEDIFREVISREQEVFLSLAKQILAKEASAVVKFQEYCRQRLGYINELANLKLLEINSWLSAKPIIADLMKSFAQHEHAIVEQILDNGKNRGEFAIESAEKTAHLIMHTIYALGFRTFKGCQEITPYNAHVIKLKEETDLLISLLLNGLLTRA